ncbi:MAG: hypothetical protein ABIY70_07645 [Capsulimonas sp.]|uniref:hypothetical protein n=1 Tax=Capsulimonas sp. TaxID=2494211 RepID=UPI003267EB1F
MTYTVELDSDIGDLISARANQRGLSVSEYLKLLAEEDVRQSDKNPSFGEQWIAVFGDRSAGTGTGKWSEVEAACDPY